uniref:Reverse transcriptase domain-containing protein n=1 Tax=Tanacetum cinerariifolium TaxID=118510 RepID=A0A6L2LNF6_TANCI|nr:reverse transcriptase domain-containing protein [Tanacetum cinerariifolium]
MSLKSFGTRWETNQNQNSSRQVVTVTTDNAPVMREPTGPLPDIKGLDEGVVLDESVETHNMEIHTSTNAGFVSAMNVNSTIDAGQYVNLEAHPGGRGVEGYSGGTKEGEGYVVLYDDRSTYYGGIATCIHRGLCDAIVVPPILAEHFELKQSLINMMTSNHFFGLEKDNPHDHIRWFNKITSTLKYKDVPNSTIKLMLFPFSLAGAARRWLEKEPPRSILTWEDLVSKFINEFFPPSRTTNLHNKISNFQQRFDESFHEAWDRYKDLLRACPHHGFTKLHQLDTFYNALNPADQDSLNSAAGGNLLERRTQDVLTIIENKSKNMMASFFQMNTASTLGLGHLPSNTIANPKGELKAITTRSGIVLDGPSIPIPPLFINPKEDERVEETLTDQDLAEDPLYPNIPYPLRMHKQKQQEKDEVQIYKFWQMFKQLHINITLADALILIPKYQKMLKSFLLNKEKLLELTNTPLNENCSAVILKKLPEKLRDPKKFLIPCGFSELKCKSLANLGSSINLIPLSVWKKLGLPELISTRMTLELANRANCTPAGIARDVFVPVGKFTFPSDFVIVDYESDPRVPLILGRPFLWTAHALIDVHGEEMILCDGDERLTLNMRHDTSSYSNQPQKESINMINIYDDSSEDFFEDLFATNHQSGNLTFSSHPNLTSPKVKDDVFDLEGGNVIIEKLLDLDSTKDLHPPHNVNPLSGSTTSSSPNHLLEEFVDELALITFSPGNDDLRLISNPCSPMNMLLTSSPPLYDEYDDDLFEVESNTEYVYDDPFDSKGEKIKECSPMNMLLTSSPPLYDEYDDDLFEVESNTEYVYDDPFDSKGEKIKESKLLIDELDLPRSSDFLPSPKYDSFLFEDFSEVDALPSTNNEDKAFNLGILIQENFFEVNTRIAPDKNVNKIAISHASLILEDFDPPLCELTFLKEVPGLKTLLSFSFENEEKVLKLKILTSKGVYFSLLPKISHRGHKVFKIIKILESPMEIFPCFCGVDIHILDVPCLHFYPS